MTLSVLVNSHLPLEDILQRDHKHLVLALAAGQLPTLALDKLSHDALDETNALVLLPLGLQGQGDLASDQRLEPVLIRLQLVSNLIALLCQLENSLNRLHLVPKICLPFLSQDERL